MPDYSALRRAALDVLPPFLSRVISKRLIAPMSRRGFGGSLNLPRRVRTVEALDAEIARADAAGAISDDALRAAFTQFEFDIDPSKLPADPFSAAYRDYQLELYRLISGRAHYNVSVDESTPFDLAAAIRRPFPYFTNSGTTTGDQLMMQGYMLRLLNLAPGGRVLEFGPGWGNTTLHMAQLGYRVTAVDVYEPFCALIQARAAQIGVQVDTVTADMLAFETDQRYDAVLFFESFHHCADHLALMHKLHHFVAPGGRVIFAGEPINSFFPYPWGVRPDGISVWSIRKFGWLELGFTPGYFKEALRRNGWSVAEHLAHDIAGYSVYVASQASA